MTYHANMHGQTPRPECPHCRSMYVRRHSTVEGTHYYVCKMCKTKFVPPRKEKASGSGVIPVPCREREWKPLQRDPFSHMRLALEGRR